MKAILEFNLPEDQEDFRITADGYKWRTVVKEMEKWLRDKVKYAPDDMSEDECNAYIVCRKQLGEIIKEENLNLE